MSVQDMIKKSVLESGMFSQYDIPKILAALAVALILGSVIYLVYQKFYVGVIFSRSFAVTLVGMTVLTCMVTLAISSNIVISLGMVGALSIVRFRTAIKDPMTGKLAVRLSMKGTYNEGKNYLFTMKGTYNEGKNYLFSK